MPDLPDHGQTTVSSLSLDPLVDHVTSEIQSLQNARPLVVAGHSFGGTLLIRAVERQPQLIDRLVVISGARRYPLDSAIGLVDGWEASEVDGWGPLLTGFVAASLGDTHVADLHEEVLQQISFPPNALRRVVARLIRSVLTDSAEGPPQPIASALNVAFLHGARDAIVPLSLAEETANLFHAGVTAIDTGSHYLPLTHSALVARHVFDGLDSHEAQREPA